jgi:hypothetical protein
MRDKRAVAQATPEDGGMQPPPLADVEEGGTVKLSELQPDPALLRDRLTKRTVKVYDQQDQLLCEFDVVALDNRLMRFVMAECTDGLGRTNNGALSMRMISAAVSDVRGLSEPPVYHTLTILKKGYQMLDMDWLDRLDSELIHLMSEQVQEINGFNKPARLRVDFS